MRIRHLVLVGLVAAFAVACGSPEEDQSGAQPPTTDPFSAAPAQSGALLPGSGKVLETMDGGGYTYVHVDIGGQQIWAAGPQVAVKQGDTVEVAGGMEMRNFESKTLGRTFPSVWFVSAIKPAGGAAPGGFHGGGMPGGTPGHTGAESMAHDRSKPVNAGAVDAVDRAEGGQTVEELVGGAADFSGKDIVVRGRVVKFNGGIMGKNWLHVQDGTGGPGTNDLTVTTDATVAVGAIVIVRGKLVTDRDFGSGYKYAVIVEDAEVTADE